MPGARSIEALLRWRGRRLLRSAPYAVQRYLRQRMQALARAGQRPGREAMLVVLPHGATLELVQVAWEERSTRPQRTDVLPPGLAFRHALRDEPHLVDALMLHGGLLAGRLGAAPDEARPSPCPAEVLARCALADPSPAVFLLLLALGQQQDAPLSVVRDALASGTSARHLADPALLAAHWLARAGSGESWVPVLAGKPDGATWLAGAARWPLSTVLVAGREAALAAARAASQLRGPLRAAQRERLAREGPGRALPAAFASHVRELGAFGSIEAGPVPMRVGRALELRLGPALCARGRTDLQLRIRAAAWAKELGLFGAPRAANPAIALAEELAAGPAPRAALILEHAELRPGAGLVAARALQLSGRAGARASARWVIGPVDVTAVVAKHPDLEILAASPDLSPPAAWLSNVAARLLAGPRPALIPAGELQVLASEGVARRFGPRALRRPRSWSPELVLGATYGKLSTGRHARGAVLDAFVVSESERPVGVIFVDPSGRWFQEPVLPGTALDVLEDARQLARAAFVPAVLVSHEPPHLGALQPSCEPRSRVGLTVLRSRAHGLRLRTAGHEARCSSGWRAAAELVWSQVTVGTRAAVHIDGIELSDDAPDLGVLERLHLASLVRRRLALALLRLDRIYRAGRG